MNWEMAGWIAIATSIAIIIYHASVGRGETLPVDGVEPDAPSAWLEIAWPVLSIATMGVLTFKEVLDFAGVLLIATLLTGIVWLIDARLLRQRRPSGTREPVPIEMAKSFFPVLLIVFFLRSFLYEPFKIPSGSMVPSLLVGDFILVNKYAYGVRLPVLNRKIVEVGLPQRGDVMVFRYPVDPAKAYIKRVIGIPGDTVLYKNKRLTINGQAIETKPTGSYTETEGGGMRFFDTFAEKLGNETHAMMTDPRNPNLDLNGILQFPQRRNCEYNDEGMSCRVPSGAYLMMGDSRDNSLDGRYWGFVPEENIVGKAVAVWLNFSALSRSLKAIN